MIIEEDLIQNLTPQDLGQNDERALFRQGNPLYASKVVQE